LILTKEKCLGFFFLKKQKIAALSTHNKREKPASYGQIAENKVFRKILLLSD